MGSFRPSFGPKGRREDDGIEIVGKRRTAADPGNSVSPADPAVSFQSPLLSFARKSILCPGATFVTGLLLQILSRGPHAGRHKPNGLRVRHVNNRSDPRFAQLIPGRTHRRLQYHTMPSSTKPQQSNDPLMSRPCDGSSFAWHAGRTVV